jgi:predicted nucleic acid-binding protein
MKERLLLDTNLIVRYLVGDHEPHARAAARIFEACDQGELALIILPEVLSECVFVLESFYKHPRDKIAGVLTTLIDSPGVEIPDPAIHADALRRYASGKLHFVDCTLAAHAAATQRRIATFDQDFRKFRDVKTFNPARELA